jgi:hypothetical protein
VHTMDKLPMASKRGDEAMAEAPMRETKNNETT